MIALIAGMFFSVIAFAADGATIESQLLAAINQARSNPSEAALRIGLDPYSLYPKDPGWNAAVVEGLPVLTNDGHLEACAAEHVDDMLVNDFYGALSSDGRTADERIREGDYWPVSTGENRGVVAFKNFMEADTAARILFENLLKQSLKEDASAPGLLFRSDFTNVGISVGTGVLTVGGVASNVYTMVCDFAGFKEIERDVIGRIERNLVGLVNQFRADPAETVFSLGLDLESLVNSFQAESDEVGTGAYEGLTELLNEILPPLVPTATLESVAVDKARAALTGMDEFPLFGTRDDGTTSRLTVAGYLPECTASFLFEIENTAIGNPSEVGVKALRQMVLDELRNVLSGGDLSLLNPEVREIGVGIEKGELKVSGETTDMMVATTLVGTTRDKKPAYLIHRVWRDDDADALCTLGEGVAGEKIVIQPASSTQENENLNRTSVTNDVGIGVIMIDSGVYRVISTMPDGSETNLGIVADNRNVWLDHRLP
jgi:hypothetical protein